MSDLEIFVWATFSGVFNPIFSSLHRNKNILKTSFHLNFAATDFQNFMLRRCFDLGHIKIILTKLPIKFSCL